MVTDHPTKQFGALAHDMICVLDASYDRGIQGLFYFVSDVFF